MFMNKALVVKQRYEQFCVVDEAAYNVRVSKTGIRHRVIIKTYLFIDFELILHNFIGSSFFLPKGSNSKLTVVNVCHGILVPIMILGNTAYLDILIFIAANDFFKYLLVAENVKHRDRVQVIVLLREHNCSG